MLIKNREDRKITEEEIITIIEEAQHSGVLDRDEGELIRSAIEFNDLAVIDVHTPRVDIAAVSNQQSKQEIASIFKQTRYSRLPVFEGSIDKIVGVIHQKDFYDINDTDMDLAGIIKPALYITPTMKISKLLKRLQKTKNHLAVITDEFGGTVGIVTLEDILEELVGEIWDEHDEIIQEFQKISDNQYKIVCNTDIEKMFRFFRLNMKGTLNASTVSGWVIRQLDRIPNEGDKFNYENLTITIHKTDFRRIIEIIVSVNTQ